VSGDDRPFIENVRKQERARTLQFVYAEVRARAAAHGASSFAATALVELGDFITYNMDVDGDGIMGQQKMISMATHLGMVLRELRGICRLIDQMSETQDEKELVDFRLNLVMRADLASYLFGRKP
jgi:hypothetical protein